MLLLASALSLDDTSRIENALTGLDGHLFIGHLSNPNVSMEIRGFLDRDKSATALIFFEQIHESAGFTLRTQPHNLEHSAAQWKELAESVLQLKQLYFSRVKLINSSSIDASTIELCRLIPPPARPAPTSLAFNAIAYVWASSQESLSQLSQSIESQAEIHISQLTTREAVAVAEHLKSRECNLEAISHECVASIKQLNSMQEKLARAFREEKNMAYKVTQKASVFRVRIYRKLVQVIKSSPLRVGIPFIKRIIRRS